MAAEPLRSGIYAILDVDRLAPLLPTEPDEELAALVAYGAVAADAGACALQLRIKSAQPHSLYPRRVYAALHEAYGARLPVLMNDFLPVVEPFVGRDGAGLHLGQDDHSPVTARHHLGEGAWLGWSTHDLAQVEAAAALPVDYIGFGPILATSGKVGADAEVGLDGLGAAFLRSQHRIVAIGGLDKSHIAEVRDAGAHAMAVIGAWLGPAEAPWSADEAARALGAMTSTWAGQMAAALNG